MKKLIGFILSFIATFFFILVKLLKFYYLLGKYVFQAVIKAFKETCEALDKGF